MVAARFTKDSSEHVLPADVRVRERVLWRKRKKGSLETQTDLGVTDKDSADTRGTRSAAVRGHVDAQVFFHTHSQTRKKTTDSKREREKKEGQKRVSIAMKQRRGNQMTGIKRPRT